MITFDPTAADFHTKLRDARKARGLTQSGLADALNISSVMTQRYEMDATKKYHARPGLETLRKLEEFFSSEPEDKSNQRPLQGHSLDALVDEIRHRGYKVNLTTVD